MQIQKIKSLKKRNSAQHQYTKRSKIIYKFKFSMNNTWTERKTNEKCFTRNKRASMEQAMDIEWCDDVVDDDVPNIIDVQSKSLFQ